MTDPTGTALAAHERVVERRDDDVFLDVQYVHTAMSRYCVMQAVPVPTVGGCYAAVTKFNLSAFVRDEIAKAIEAYQKAMREGE